MSFEIIEITRWILELFKKNEEFYIFFILLIFSLEIVLGFLSVPTWPVVIGFSCILPNFTSLSIAVFSNLISYWILYEMGKKNLFVKINRKLIGLFGEQKRDKIYLLLFLAKLCPYLPYGPFAYCAGVLKLNLRLFFLITGMSSTIINILYVMIGEQGKKLFDIMNSSSNLTLPQILDEISFSVGYFFAASCCIAVFYFLGSNIFGKYKKNETKIK